MQRMDASRVLIELGKKAAGWALVAFTLYETSPKGNSEPQNSRITNHAEDVICDPNVEGWFRYAQSFL